MAPGETAVAADYLATLETEIKGLVATFPALWAELTGLPGRRRLARVLARL
jgi:hypothetical protein